MIVLLSYSINLSASSPADTFYGAANTEDSVLIAYDDLRNVNSKLIELKYEKDINARYKNIIKNDSLIISSYVNDTNNLIRKNRKLTKQNRGLTIGIIATIAALIVSFIK